MFWGSFDLHGIRKFLSREENIKGKSMRIWIGIIAFSLQTCGFADWDTKEICDLRTGTPQKFADLRLRNEPKILRTNKKICDSSFGKG